VPDRETEGNGRQGLGTFAGVFTPSILTILGVIMYLRLGWVVGSVGLPATLNTDRQELVFHKPPTAH